MGYMICFVRDPYMGYMFWIFQRSLHGLHVLVLSETLHGSFICFGFVRDPTLVHLHMILVFDGDPYGLV